MTLVASGRATDHDPCRRRRLVPGWKGEAHPAAAVDHEEGSKRLAGLARDKPGEQITATRGQHLHHLLPGHGLFENHLAGLERAGACRARPVFAPVIPGRLEHPAATTGTLAERFLTREVGGRLGGCRFAARPSAVRGRWFRLGGELECGPAFPQHKRRGEGASGLARDKAVEELRLARGEEPGGLLR